MVMVCLRCRDNCSDSDDDDADNCHSLDSVPSDNSLQYGSLSMVQRSAAYNNGVAGDGGADATLTLTESMLMMDEILSDQTMDRQSRIEKLEAILSAATLMQSDQVRVCSSGRMVTIPMDTNNNRFALCTDCNVIAVGHHRRFAERS